MSDDFLSLLMKIRMVFISQNIKPPTAILLADNEQGMKLLSLLAGKNLVFQPGQYGTPIEHSDGSIWMELDLFGMKIHWPAKSYALHDGSFKWQ